MSYTRSQLAEIAGISEPTLRKWINQGYIPRAGSKVTGGNYTDLHLWRVRELIRTCKDGRVTMREFAERHEVRA